MLIDFIIAKIKKAEIFYKNNYYKTINDKSNNYYTDIKIILVIIIQIII